MYDVRQSARPPGTAAAAFDLLHERHAPALVRQTFLLCGGGRLARRSVAHAFRLAWRRWPRVALDPDPAGWVRTEAYRHALAPSRRLRPVRAVRRVRAMRHVPPGDRELLDALLRLPCAYHSALLLHDGLGLSLRETAAEVEATLGATNGRLRHARTELAARLPELREVPAAALPGVVALLVGQLAAPQPVSLPPARKVRRSGEIRAWCATAAALGLPAAVAALVLALTAPGAEPDPASPPVPKPPSATLGPQRQPGRLHPDVGVRAPSAELRRTSADTSAGTADGPASRRCAREAGPFVVGA